MTARTRSLLVAGLAFFASGASALVYQVAWQRILALHTGVGIASIAVIVASFMAGIGLGSHLGGVLSTHLAPPRALRTFGLLEEVNGGKSLPGEFRDPLFEKVPTDTETEGN